jgi:cold shock CspA family protein
MTNTPHETDNTRQPHADPERDYIGYVKWFDDSKGYGFVRILTPGDHYENDVFVHQSNVHPQRSTYRTLRESETVRFNLSEESDDKAIPQVVELVGVNGRLYCDSRVRRKPTQPNSHGDADESTSSNTTVADAAGDPSQWKRVNKRSNK